MGNQTKRRKAQDVVVVGWSEAKKHPRDALEKTKASTGPGWSKCYHCHFLQIAFQQDLLGQVLPFGYCGALSYLFVNALGHDPEGGWKCSHVVAEETMKVVTGLG